MTDPTRPRLAAAAEAAMDSSVETDLPVEPTREECLAALRTALAPYVPERDELVVALREWCDEQEPTSDSETFGAAYDPVAAVNAAREDAATEIRALLARHAPEPTDG